MSISEHIDALEKAISSPKAGLPEELFLFVSDCTPLVNVDLLIRDDDGRVLLSWRNDRWWGEGWHIPGGVLRLGETLDERIHNTAIGEIGIDVEYEREPLEIKQLIYPHMSHRSHHVSFVYACYIPREFILNAKGVGEGNPGYLKWHRHFPDNMLRCHDFYRKYFVE